MGHDRPLALIYGNCQGEWLRGRLEQAQCLQGIDFHYIANFSVGEIRPMLPADEDWARCRFLLQQVAPRFLEFPYADRLPAGCRILRYPALWLKAPWPLDASDPLGGRPEEGHPYGRFPYGDRLAMKLRDQGLPPEEVLRQYFETDITRMLDLDRFAEMAFSELDYIDSLADVQTSPFIQANWRDTRLFASINHPSFLLLFRLAHHALAFLTDDPGYLDAGPPPDGLDYLGDTEIPVHPQVAEHFGLKWAPPGINYRYRTRMLDFREFLQAYVSLEAIPIGECPEVWLGRADQAARWGDGREYFRMLASGLERYPRTSAFCIRLAAFMRQSRHYRQAEQFLEFGLRQSPGDTDLHNELGVLAKEQGDYLRSRAHFIDALKAQPASVQAWNNLVEVQARLGVPGTGD